MRFTFDAVFLDRNNTVLEIVRMPPFRVSPYVAQAHAVLEIPNARFIRKGDLLEFIPG